MYSYTNGNYTVDIFDDGTKKRHKTFDNQPFLPEYPESIDIKVTNKCNGACSFCHENSSESGESFNPLLLYNLIENAPAGMEVTMSGGNPFEVAEELRWLTEVACPHLIFNLTINSMHLDQYWDSWLFPVGMGVSYNKDLHNKIKDFQSSVNFVTPQLVMHVIAGIHTLDDVKRCLQDFDRVLISGFKYFGRGATFDRDKMQDRLNIWKRDISTILSTQGKILAFDGLALKQLDIKRFYSDKTWSKMYMGDDGQFGMYIDAVKMEYAKNSYSQRFPIENKSLQEIFKHIRNLCK